MQTFLPCRSFVISAKCLDPKRLGKQRVEAYQLINAIEKKKQGIKVGYANHPALLMWENNLDALKFYSDCMVGQWIVRGYKNTLPIYLKSALQVKFPDWLIDEEKRNKLIESHRSNLLRKDKEYYSQFNWNVPDNLPYYWPVKCKNSKV